MSDFHNRLIDIGYVMTGGMCDWSEWHAYYDPVTRMYCGEPYSMWRDRPKCERGQR